MIDKEQANCASPASGCYAAPSLPLGTPQFSYVWAMPDSNTFKIPAIRGLVKWHLSQAAISVDFFSRNNRWATYTNDLNPETAAEYHMDAEEFGLMLLERKVEADLILFDPPYSTRQIKECYANIGLDMPYERTIGWGKLKDIAAKLLKPDGIAITFGWNSIGLGMERGFRKESIMLVCHGRLHNDTIVTVERKIASPQLSMFEEAA